MEGRPREGEGIPMGAQAGPRRKARRAREGANGGPSGPPGAPPVSLPLLAFLLALSWAPCEFLELLNMRPAKITVFPPPPPAQEKIPQGEGG